MSGIIAATGFADSAFAQNFYKSFLANGRWELYVSGLGRTLEVTVLALLLGVILGVITALLRVAHDQRRPGRHSVGSVLLSICNAITRIYITVIRGTPAIVQLMILGFVVFTVQPQLHAGRRAGSGHQLRRLCGRDHPRRPDEHGRGPDGGRAAPWG